MMFQYVIANYQMLCYFRSLNLEQENREKEKEKEKQYTQPQNGEGENSEWIHWTC